MEEAVGKFLIVSDLEFNDFMKDEDGNLVLYDSYEDASLTCGMYEFENALILEVKSHYAEKL